MKLKHFIIEGFCPEHKGKSLPCKNSFQFSMECYRCPEFSYAPSPLELAFSDKDGIVRTLDDWCGFGGAMLPARNEAYWKNIWQDICREINALPDPDTLDAIYASFHVKRTLGDIDVSEERLEDLLRYSHLVRNRLTLMRLAKCIHE